MNTTLTIFFDLVLNDFRSRYLNNVMGTLWAFVQPAMTMLIFWFVFTVGFRATPVADMPYALWIITGMVPWFFLSESIVAGTNAVIEKDYLVKKIVFNVEILPAVKIASALGVHFVFVLIMIGVFIAYDYHPSLSWLQLVYYIFSGIPLLLGITWLCASVIVFFRDLGHIVAMVVQFTFWLTPIVWPLSMVPVEYRWIFALNPFHTLVDGYRNAFTGNGYFWDNPLQLGVFWAISLGIMWLGLRIFRKLRSHFADVL